MGEIVEGPWTRDWHCPTCARRAPLFLPNGTRNRLTLTVDDYCLEAPDIRAEARGHGVLEPVEVCWSCGESVPYLVGSLVVPYGQQGTVLAGAGAGDIQLLGAVLPTAGRSRSGLMVFFGAGKNGLAVVDWQSLAAFTAGRLTSPEERGEIPDRIWELNRHRLAWLADRSSGEHER
ncbi:hypothetical protein [Thiohalorhabdus sp.]|uniref:hypothetical protein n=1 Tax=Thiohalorhabdus sp. TaxID=3094134 RepID=UPI002FC34509